MILPLRQRHRYHWIGLTVALPLAFAAGIAARRSVPLTAAPRPAWTLQVPGFDSVVWTRTDLWPNRDFVTTLRRDATGPRAIELEMPGLVGPDVLVYWVAGKETTLQPLPDDARLLGAGANRAAWVVPEAVRGASGRLVLYSLADHDIVAASRVFTVGTE